MGEGLGVGGSSDSTMFSSGKGDFQSAEGPAGNQTGGSSSSSSGSGAKRRPEEELSPVEVKAPKVDPDGDVDISVLVKRRPRTLEEQVKEDLANLVDMSWARAPEGGEQRMKHGSKESVYDVAEIFSPTRTAERARRRGLRGGWSLDNNVRCPVTGRTWDLLNPKDQQAARSLFYRTRPKLLVASPPCTKFCALQNFHKDKMDPPEVCRGSGNGGVCGGALYGPGPGGPPLRL